MYNFRENIICVEMFHYLIFMANFSLILQTIEIGETSLQFTE